MRDDSASQSGACYRQSDLLAKCSREVAGEERSINAQLLGRAGYIHRLMAGVYTMLPLGFRVLQKIEDIIRDEMQSIGGVELSMPALHPSEPWVTTGRWDTVDVLFRFKGAGDRDLALGPTHEEVITPLAANFIESYRDLPAQVFQIQTKFRNELRAKSGLLRGREFRMKDLYSFHTSQSELDEYYDCVAEAYRRIFNRCGIGERTVYTFATGGAFSRYSHEFQTLTEHGEDQIYRIPGADLWINHELLDDEEALSGLGVTKDHRPGSLESAKAIEVGNIFKLGTRFSDAFGLSFVDRDGTQRPVIMGCYGLGSTRLMGAVVECSHDERGIVWPDTIAPFSVHLISLARTDVEKQRVLEIYEALRSSGAEVLFDDRERVSPGQKFTEADLIGIPNRVVVGQKSFVSDQVELKRRDEQDMKMLALEELLNLL